MIGAAYQRATTAQSTPAFELLINYPYHKENPDVFFALGHKYWSEHKSLDPNNPWKNEGFNP